MQILKGYVFRMYPTEKQEELINKTIGCSRFIYNYFLDDKIKEYKEISKSKSAYEQIKLIPSLSKEKEWIKEIKTYKIKLKIQRFGKIYVILKAIYLINKFWQTTNIN